MANAMFVDTAEWHVIQVFPGKDTEILGSYPTEAEAEEFRQQLNQQNPSGFYETVFIAEE